MKQYIVKLLLFTMFITSAFVVKADVYSKEKMRLTDGWEYVKGDLGGVWEAIRPVKKGAAEAFPIWDEVVLPHCFDESTAVEPDKNYYQGVGWYRKYMTFENPYEGGRIILDFEGAGQKTELYVYDTKVASHVGGYDGWSVDITDAVANYLSNSAVVELNKGKVPIVVRCDNTRDLEMVPSDLSDFNLYGGLYRYVNLVYTPKVSISNIALESTLDDLMREGVVNVSANFYNPDDVKSVELDVELIDPNGDVVYNDKKSSFLPLGKQELSTFVVKKPILWDVDSPKLYTVRITTTIDGVSQTIDERFGFRTFSIEEQGPFYLNGRRLLLRGTHRHEDHAGVGAAMTEEMIRKEFSLMKEMGVNFIRLGHYQQSDIALELCDELGILVWEEVPWCRGGVGGEEYKEQVRRMLRHMISQHYNHPSIIFWGMGNENDWPGDFNEFNKGDIRAFLKELNDLSHSLDDSRLTSIRRCTFAPDVIDVYSSSLWAGWYRGFFTQYRSFTESDMKLCKKFFHVEWGGDSHRGRFVEYPLSLLRPELGADMDQFYTTMAKKMKRHDWSESYIARVFDWHLKEQETMPYLSGTAAWVFKDFSTPLRPENPVPYVNQKGVIERDFTKKESFYIFQSYWTEKPMVHIFGHNWAVRWGDVDEPKEMLVYSNCPAVELFVNGVSYGVKKRNSQDFPAAGLRWYVPMHEGENNIRAVGISGKESIEDSITQEYQTAKWGEPANIIIREVSRDGDDVLLEAQYVDSKGVRCLDSADMLYFDVAGDGELIKDQGTSTGSDKVGAYNGRAQMRLTLSGEKAIFVAKGDNVPTAYYEVER